MLGVRGRQISGIFSLLFSADENLIELINKQLNHNTVNAGL